MIASAYTGTYYLESNIHITDGATLEIDGEISGTSGCKVLLLVSGQLDVLRLHVHFRRGCILYAEI